MHCMWRGKTETVVTDALAEKLSKNLKAFSYNDLLSEELKYTLNEFDIALKLGVYKIHKIVMID